MTEKQALKDFTDRELLELLLCNQIDIIREVKRIQDKLETGKTLGRGQFWITFKNMLTTKRSALTQIDEYLHNKDKWDESYDEEKQGHG